MKCTQLKAAAVFATLLILCGRAAWSAGTDTWSSTGTGTNWNSAANCLTVGGSTPPAPDDSLIFDVDSAAGTAVGHKLNNDLTNATFNIGGIIFNAAAPAYVIGDGSTTANAGNPFVLTT